MNRPSISDESRNNKNAIDKDLIKKQLSGTYKNDWITLNCK